MGNIATAGTSDGSATSGSFDLTPFGTGFDPIFYLHHCQVDRLLSVWSAAHPGVWVTESHQEGDTVTIPNGTVINKHTRECMTG